MQEKNKSVQEIKYYKNPQLFNNYFEEVHQQWKKNRR